MTLLPLLFALLVPPVQEAPPPDPAGALWQELSDAHLAAQALEVRGKGRVELSDGEATYGMDVTFEARVARPVHGRVRVLQKSATGSSDVDLVGTGERVVLVDNGAREYAPLGDAWVPILQPEPALLTVWRGEEVVPLSTGLVAPDGATDSRAVRGLQLVLGDRRETDWLDAEGAPVAADIATADGMHTAHYVFDTWRVHPVADLAAFRTSPPEGYVDKDPTAELEKDLLALGSTIPDVTVLDLSGDEVRLSSLRGKTLLLNFWFRECPSCNAEMPRLQGLWTEVSGARKDVAFLAIDLGDSPEVIRSWWEEEGFTLRAVREEGGRVSEAFGVRAYPTNYVVGPDGRVLYRGVGYDEAALRRALQSTKATR